MTKSSEEIAAVFAKNDLSKEDIALLSSLLDDFMEYLQAYHDSGPESHQVATLQAALRKRLDDTTQGVRIAFAELTK